MNRHSLLGQAPAFLDAIEQAGRAAMLDRPVLVIGERGTGKELIVQRLHHLSPRWDKPFVTMNCAALPETLIEAELFGHEAGAFTGAVRARTGRFEEADGGTLFLDELGTLSMAAQERLLRVIEYGEVTRIGASRPMTVDVRIVGATNENLPQAAAQHRFRADLLDRLSFEVITLPPLRAREGDVAELADHFGRRMASELGWTGWPGFAIEVLKELEGHDWPGNIRELRNVTERAVYRWAEEDGAVGRIMLDPFQSPWAPVRGEGGQSEGAQPSGQMRPAEDMVSTLPASSPAADRSESGSPESGPDNLRDAVAAYERRLIEQALSRHRHNQRATAQALGLSYDQLRHSLRKYGLL